MTIAKTAIMVNTCLVFQLLFLAEQVISDRAQQRDSKTAHSKTIEPPHVGVITSWGDEEVGLKVSMAHGEFFN